MLAVCISCTLLSCSDKGQDRGSGSGATSDAHPSETPSRQAVSGQATGSAASGAVTVLPRVEASGRGKDKSDVPLIISCRSLDKEFNPFSAVSEDDRKAVDLTQLRLLAIDRSGALVRKAIDGVDRSFRGEEYHYQGPADIKVHYDRVHDQTAYVIRIRKDIVFSDGTPVTINDVIFSMYAFADSSYKGGETFGDLPVVGIKAYQRECREEAQTMSSRNRGKDPLKNKVSVRRAGSARGHVISGIEKVNAHKLKITLKGYDRDHIQALNIPVCPLHYYGDAHDFHVRTGHVGFEQGDISTLIKKKMHPLGAGAYQFIKYESGVVYYEANEDYYLGCPLTAFIQLKETGGRSAHEILKALAAGEFDVADVPGSNNAVRMIMRRNASESLSGKVFDSKPQEGDHYTYIGMNAERVCVADRPDSTRSRKFRRALAILFSCSRRFVLDICNKGAKVIDYPASSTSWSVPQAGDDGYEQAYGRDADGGEIYSSSMTVDECMDAACQAALGYLEQAGFILRKGQVVSAPEDTDLRYTIHVPLNFRNTSMLTLARNAKRLFQRVGLQLVIRQEKNWKKIGRILDSGKYQFWCGREETSVNGQMHQMYHSDGADNYFHIEDSDLDEYIEETQKTIKQKKSVDLYRQCYQKIMDWAVMVPFYQEQRLTVFSAKRVGMDTVSSDIGGNYDWTQDIHLLEMR